MTKQYIVNKYLPAHAGRIEIMVTASTIADYEIDQVYFIAQNGDALIKEELTFFMLAMRVFGPIHYGEKIDEWIQELLPCEMAADTFLEEADKAYDISA